MAYPYYVTKGSIQSDTTGDGSIAVTMPAHAVDDILLVAATNDAGGDITTATSGWNEIAEVNGDKNMNWFWKRATSTTGEGPTITSTGTDLYTIPYVIRGCITTGTPYEDATTAGDGNTASAEATPDTATVTTTSVDRLVLCILNVNNDTAWTTAPPPSGWHKLADDSSGTGTDTRFTLIAYQQPSAGDVTSAVVGTISASEVWASLTLAFIPADTTTNNNAVRFYQDRNFGSVANYTALNDMTDGTGTIEFWVKNTSGSLAYSTMVQTDNGTTSIMTISTENATGSTGVNFKYDYGVGTDADGYKASGVVDVDTWVHIALVCSNGSVSRVYKNGSEITGYGLQRTPSGTPTSHDNSVIYIAASGGVSDFAGSIGGFVRIWSTARTATELNDNKALTLQSASETGLIANFNFTEERGSTIDNEYSAGNDVSFTDVDGSGGPLWVGGPTTSAKSYGTSTNDSRNAKIRGQSSTNDTRNAKVRGSSTANESRSAKVTGALSANDSRDAKVHGTATTNDSRSAKVRGSLSANDSRDAKIHGQALASDTRDAKVHGTADTSDSRDAKIRGSLSTNDSRDSKIRGQASANDSRDAKVRGQSTANDIRDARVKGSLSSNDSRDAKVHGVATTNDTRDAKIRGSSSANDERVAKITGDAGATEVNSERDAKIRGQDSANSARDAKVYGISTANDSRDAKVRGSESANDTRQAKVKGQDNTFSTRDARVIGQDITNDTRSSKIRGSSTSNDERSAKVKGITYTSQYPPAYNSTYVKATTTAFEPTFEPWFTCNPALSLTGNWNNQQWVGNSPTNQRFHIDLGEGKVIKRIYYENSHYGPDPAAFNPTGVQNFTFWGSNEASAFNELTYGTDTNWTQITTAVSTFDQHVLSDVADPKYITVTNTTAYRYYAFKFADNYGNASFMGVRRIELQIQTPTVDSRSAKITGEIVTQSERSAKITGSGNTANSERSANVNGQDTTNSARSAKVKGQDTSNSSRDSKIRGEVSVNDSRQAKVGGQDTASSARDSKVHGQDTANDSRDAKVRGSDSSFSIRDAKITGGLNVNSDRQAKIHGSDTATSERAAKITGNSGTTVNSTRQAKVAGNSSTNDSRPAKISGQSTANDSRNAKVDGSNSAYSEKPARIIGFLDTHSERSAKILGGLSIVDSIFYNDSLTEDPSELKSLTESVFYNSPLTEFSSDSHSIVDTVFYDETIPD